MKPLAAFTIARNEAFWLPRWLRYYAKTGADLYVLDHESDDGSTDNSAGGFVRFAVTRPHTDDVGWMLRTVEEFHAKLFEQYARVIFAECDEFLVPDPAAFPDLKAYLEATPKWAVNRAIGFNLCPGRTWKRVEMWDKTLISDMPLRWEPGFHRPHAELRLDVAPDARLLLLHGHYLDRETQWERLAQRRRGREAYPNDWGRQNKCPDRAAFDGDFSNETAGAYPMPEPLVRILEDIL